MRLVLHLLVVTMEEPIMEEMTEDIIM